MSVNAKKKNNKKINKKIIKVSGRYVTIDLTVCLSLAHCHSFLFVCPFFPSILGSFCSSHVRYSLRRSFVRVWLWIVVHSEEKIKKEKIFFPQWREINPYFLWCTEKKSSLHLNPDENTDLEITTSFL